MTGQPVDPGVRMAQAQLDTHRQSLRSEALTLRAHVNELLRVLEDDGRNPEYQARWAADQALVVLQRACKLSGMTEMAGMLSLPAKKV